MTQINHYTGLVCNNDSVREAFKVRAGIGTMGDTSELLAAYQVPHPEGRDYWVAALFDEDNGAYVIEWLDGEWVSPTTMEYTDEQTDELNKKLAIAACEGFVRGYLDFSNWAGPRIVRENKL